VEPKGRGSNLALALRTTGEALKRRGVVIVISDFKTHGYLPDLTLMGRRHDVIAIRIVDPLDREFPRTGLIRLEDPESRRTILAPGSSDRFGKAYRDFWEAERRSWLAECRRRRIGTLEVFTDQDPAAQLIRFFESRKSG
jgi:uncharacterized protein (DUF58 family)